MKPIKSVSIEKIRVPPLSPKLRIKLEEHKSYLKSIPSPPREYNLLAYQTSVKDQNPRGTCMAFAFIGAIEAIYLRKYNLNLDLSEEYYLQMGWSTQSVNNKLYPHENFCSGAPWDETEYYVNVMKKPEYNISNIKFEMLNLILPEEEYAPYFGNANSGTVVYGTDHREVDLQEIAFQNGILDKDNNGNYSVHKNQNGVPELTQEAIDKFEYDNRYIPLEARKNAIYGATFVKSFEKGDAQDPDFLERSIADNHEVVIVLDLGHPPKNERFLLDQGVTKTISGFNTVVLDYDASGNTGNFQNGGHAVLLVGYDRPNKRFLFKNSWGIDYSYFWVPYQYVIDHNYGGYIVTGVRDPQFGPDPAAMLIGNWNMDHDGALGTLVIRRTHIPGNATSGVNTRLGTYYSSAGNRYKVTGKVYGTLYPKGAILCIDFNTLYNDRSSSNYNEVAGGQVFDIEIFQSNQSNFTFGNFAPGFTKLNGLQYGVLLSRPNIHVPHKPGIFAADKWPGEYKVYQDTENGDLTITASSSNPSKFKVEYHSATAGESSIADCSENPIIIDLLSKHLHHHTMEIGIASGRGVFIILSNLLDSFKEACGGSPGEPISLREIADKERPGQGQKSISMRGILEYS